uniref:Flocculation protein FLO11-like isoform X1 n=1 Tax=Dermatophagoides pteronyssinus TaxID=6956 RepID=A0A6P6Y642_DERPT|nr:flocculation protein FLO11-like isoform X1 [Dermatophagoides pteronyssinus]
MKLLFVFAILVITVYAKDDYGEKEFAKRLLEDCEHLNQKTLSLIEDYERHQKGHLLETVKHEAEMIKPLIDELKKDSEETDSLKQISRLHVIEERSFYRENRISEEMEIVQEIIFDYKSRQMTVGQVIERAKMLVEIVSEALENNQVTQRNQEPVQFELQLLNKMIKLLETEDHNIIAVTDEERLARIEKSLHQLIKNLQPIPTPTTPVPTTTERSTTGSSTTESSTTVSSTTEPSTTESSTTESSTTGSPTTGSSTTESSTTESSTTGSPTTGSSTTEPSTTESSTTGSPTTGSSTTGSSTTESSTTESSTTGSPTTGSSTTGSSTTESSTSTRKDENLHTTESP